ncbi:MAG: hypothetical protein H6566_28780 [Lewinellaceae bacterium]|nr:hypothetical protein [Lewinellaceae bacterium]
MNINFYVDPQPNTFFWQNNGLEKIFAKVAVLVEGIRYGIRVGFLLIWFDQHLKKPVEMGKVTVIRQEFKPQFTVFFVVGYL